MTGNNQARSLEQLLNDGWNCHDKESEQLARELEAAAEQGIASPNLVAFLHLSTHTIGEHLGDWVRALRLGRRVLDGQVPTLETAQAWGRLYVAAVLAGDATEATDLQLSYLRAVGDEFGAALLDMRFMLAGALLALRHVSEAARLYRSALDLVGQFRQSAQLQRTIAIASNNLGWELYEMPVRSAHDDALMHLCAETSLEFWLKCGNWVNEERALYLRALVSNVTGRPESGLADAERALAVINAQGERPLDAALLHLARASAFAALGDASGRLRAIDNADAAASKLTAPTLKEQFDTQRFRIAAVDR